MTAPSEASAVASAAGSAGTPTRAASGIGSSARNPRGRGAPRPGLPDPPVDREEPAPRAAREDLHRPEQDAGDSAAAASTPATTASTALPRASTSRAACATCASDAAAARAPSASSRSQRSLLLVVANDDAAARPHEPRRPAARLGPRVARELAQALGLG